MEDEKPSRATVTIQIDDNEQRLLVSAVVRALHATGAIKDLPEFADVLEQFGERSWYVKDGKVVTPQSPQRLAKTLREHPEGPKPRPTDQHD